MASASGSAAASAGLLNLEKELICFICTEVLYQPLTLIDCLHTFCGSCLKEWFSHQHRKALSSRSTSSSSKPYTCPTCRASVKDARHNATVTTLLDMFLAANPSRGRTADEKDEMAQVYTPGQDILPKVEQRRRRHRREEEDAETHERRMIDEARERSLRDAHRDPRTASERLTTPSDRQQASRSRERSERRDARRDQDRAERRRRIEAAEAALPQERTSDLPYRTPTREDITPPPTSPRHPDAVEARQPMRPVAHQASLRSLVSASESGTGTGDSLDEVRVMQEILAEGLLDGIDVERLTETEQDALSERIAELYRQRHPRPNERPSLPTSSSSISNSGNGHDSSPHIVPQRPAGPGRQSSYQERERSRSSQQSRHTIAGPGTSQQQQPLQSSSDANLSPPVAHRTQNRRMSDRSRRQTSPSPSAPNVASPSATDLSQAGRVPGPAGDRVRTLSDNRRTNSEPIHTLPKASEVWRQAQLGSSSREQSTTRAETASHDIHVHASPQLRLAQLPCAVEASAGPHQAAPQLHKLTQISVAVAGPDQSHTDDNEMIFPEPSVTCSRCSRSNLQYEVYKHCQPCDMDLCLRCYRSGRGCAHWFGFGHAASAKFSASGTDRSSKLIEQPHVLSGRQYLKAPADAVRGSEDGSVRTTINPADRLQEGHFCDRCGAFSNACFWSCAYCNEGEWGFCNDCVDTHHCCTHPLLPIAHRLFAPKSSMTQLAADYDLTTYTPGCSRPSTPHSVNSVNNIISDYVALSITATCDVCHQAIAQSQPRYHCPLHVSPGTDAQYNLGGYDICMTCYHNQVRAKRVKTDDGPMGWRKCQSGHRMIVIAFESDHTGSQRRVVLNDLVGGWKCTKEDMAEWDTERAITKDVDLSTNTPLPPNSMQVGEWSWREDTAGARRTRSRKSTLNSLASPTTTSPSSTSNTTSNTNSTSHNADPSQLAFPPESIAFPAAVAGWSYIPDAGDEGTGELLFPKHAEIREIEEINDEWWHGVYAGEQGLFPAVYVRMV